MQAKLNEKRHGWAWLAAFGILAVYWAFPTRNYYWDGIAFAQAIEDAPGLGPLLIHPNHLYTTPSAFCSTRLR